MSGLSRIALYVSLVVVFLLGSSGLAAAQGAKGQSIHVLSIDSDDADEQAEALTAALRAHVRETGGWTLLETTQSLSMLTAAFQCPQRPDPTCLQRIGDKLKADQLIWGVMSKAPNHQVNVDMHLWSRGKPEQVARDSYSDNMKDSNDDGLKKLATQIFGKLLGLAGGTLVLHASGDAGTVIVDGQPKGALDHGRITLALAAGPHTVEVQAPGFASTKRDVTIQPSATSNLEVILEADAAAPIAGGAPGKPLPLRKILGWSAIGAGGVLIIVGAIMGANYLSDQSDLNTARNHNYGEPAPVLTDPCNPPTTNNQTVAGCNALNSAHSAEVGEITTFAIGGVLAAGGIYLLVTDHPAPDAPPPPAKTGLSDVHFLPTAGPGGGSLVVVGRF